MSDEQGSTEATNTQEPKAPKAPKPKALMSRDERVYESQVVFDSDLFRLKTSKMKKNITPNKDQDAWFDVDHQHFFHTVDSSGKSLSHSAAVGGHFHVLKVHKDKEGNILKIDCSGPKEFKRDKKTGRNMIVDSSLALKDKKIYNPSTGEEVDHPGFDKHTHEIEYIRSSKLQLKNGNTEAAKFLAQEAAKYAPVEGISATATARPVK